MGISEKRVALEALHMKIARENSIKRRKADAALRRQDVELTKVNRRMALIVGNNRKDCQLKVLEFVREGLRCGKELSVIRKELGIKYSNDPRWTRISKSLRNTVLNDERVSEYLKKVDDATAVLWGQFERVRQEYEKRCLEDEEEMQKEVSERDPARLFPTRDKISLNKSMRELYDSIANRNMEIVKFGVDIGSIEKDEKVTERQQPIVIINQNMARPTLDDAGTIDMERVNGASIQRYRIGDLDESNGTDREIQSADYTENPDPLHEQQEPSSPEAGRDPQDAVDDDPNL